MPYVTFLLVDDSIHPWVYFLLDSRKSSPKKYSLIQHKGYLNMQILILTITIYLSHSQSKLQITPNTIPCFWSDTRFQCHICQASINRISKVWGCICHTFNAAYSSKHSFNWASLYPCPFQIPNIRIQSDYPQFWSEAKWGGYLFNTMIKKALSEGPKL